MKQILWAAAFAASLCCVALGLLWERPVPDGGRTTTEVRAAEQPECWRDLAVRDPSFRPRRGRAERDEADRREGRSEAQRSGRRRRGGGS